VPGLWPTLPQLKKWVASGIAARTKPQAPRPLQHWLASSFEAGIGRESQEVNRRMLKQP
jgi:hypothetical protein